MIETADQGTKHAGKIISKDTFIPPIQIAAPPVFQLILSWQPCINLAKTLHFPCNTKKADHTSGLLLLSYLIRGNDKVKAVPLPTLLSAMIFPFIFLTSWLAIDNPSPLLFLVCPVLH